MKPQNTRRAKPSNVSRSSASRLAYETLEPRQLLAADFLITEFQASNDSTLQDDAGRTSDWIEIYNAGTSAGNLQGYSLTDDADDTTKWQFPSVSLAAGSYLTVFAADDANPNSGSDLYTGFALGSSGEYLGLFDPTGTAVSQYNSDDGQYPPQQIDGSYGLAFNGSVLSQPLEEGYFATPTPGASNSNQFAGVVEPVEFSVNAGFFDSSFALTLSTDTPGSLIRYTTDGSEPSLSNGFTYSSFFNVTGTRNVRAIAFAEDYIPSSIETRTYLFLDDILNQSSNEQPPAGWPSSWGSNDVDYGMDPQVIATEGEQAVKDALLAIPSWSITTELDNLFDPGTGIYSNATQDGRAWERPASVELIQPDGSEGFQINAGLRIRGGYSRNDFNPKHSFRLFFRNEYGQSTLKYPIHGDEGVDEFRKIDLRTAQNYSWSSEGNTRNNFVQDVMARYAQRDLGQPYTRSSWLHLYLNGQYWGLFQTQERAEANFAASYFGGAPDEYDVIKAQWTASNPTDGNLAAYHELSEQAHARAPDGRTPAFVDNAAYYKAQGLNVDGTENPEYETLLDVDNLIAYMMIVLAGGNLDAPISNFGNNERINNYYTIRNRNGNEGFKFFVHDSEHTLLNVNENRNGPYNHPNFDNGNSFFNPQWLHQQLMANEEYRVRFADQVQAAFFNGGPLSAEAQIARMDEEAAKIDQAIIAESVRWGDSKRNNPLLRSDWVNALDNIRNNFLANRNPILINQFQNTTLRLKNGNNSYNIVVPAPLFPDVSAPQILVDGVEQYSGEIQSGASARFTSAEGTVWYTTDGSDPREVGGNVNPSATQFSSASTSETVIAASSSGWRFEDSGTDLGTAWRNPSYNDSGWGQGSAQLGYGDGDEATTVSFGNDSSNKQPTTYFRRSFVAPSGDPSSITLRFLRDDGVVLYLNGVEVTRSNMPSGTVNYQTRATTFAGGAQEQQWFEVNVPVGLLLPGQENVLAAEIHQFSENVNTNITSSDISFDAELIVVTPAPGSQPITLTDSTNLQTRTRRADGTWSALQAANLFVASQAASADNLRVTELLYNSSVGNVEFIEIQNISSGPIDLAGVTVTEGPSEPFEFLPTQSLAAGERAVIVNDTMAFAAAYPNVDPASIFGEFTGGLSNSGEQIRFETNSGETIVDFTYNDNDPWPFLADGDGASLELIDPAGTPADQLSKYYRWQASALSNGTPTEAGVASSGVVINEVLAHTDAPAVDSIELHNPTGQAIDVGGWFLSDSAASPFKYEIPAGTIIAAGGYSVFDESDFNPNPTNPGVNDFALSSSSGDDVLLSRPTITAGVLGTIFEDAVTFGATFNGESVGRLPNGTGLLTRLSNVSLGAPNEAAKTGPLVISEFNYHPADPSAVALQFDPTITDNDLEFIEVHNPTANSVNLQNWQIRGEVDFDFPAMNLAAGESIVVVSFDPNAAINSNLTNAFLAHYGTISAELVGPWTGGSLSNGSGRIALRQPDSPELDFIPRVVVDEVVYDDIAPWANADGTGGSLNRGVTSQAGNLAATWQLAVPTPGEAMFENDPPTVVSNVRDGGNIDRPDLWDTLAVTFSEDVSVSASSLEMVNQSVGASAVDLSAASFNYNSATFTATWNFDALNLDAAFYEVSLDDVQGASSGLSLDGDGNGSAGGTFAASYYVAIPGDADLDGQVNVLQDAATVVDNLGTVGTAAWADGDFNADGNVNVLDDAALLVNNLGRNVQPPSAVMALAVPVGVAIDDDVSTNALAVSQNPIAPTSEDSLALAGSVESSEIDNAFEEIDWL